MPLPPSARPHSRGSPPPSGSARVHPCAWPVASGPQCACPRGAAGGCCGGPSHGPGPAQRPCPRQWH
eukprot:14317253-Alexandrium_andersonii.AAC.1